VKWIIACAFYPTMNSNNYPRMNSNDLSRCTVTDFGEKGLGLVTGVWRRCMAVIKLLC
jgi:hypothetical protein